MIYTSYFAKYKGKDGIAITRFRPDWWNGEWMPSLSPSIELLNWWKSLSKEEQHRKENLDKYKQTYLMELGSMRYSIVEIAPKLQNKVLLCYENLNKDFCHRQVLAELFRSYGFDCEELSYNKGEDTNGIR